MDEWNEETWAERQAKHHWYFNFIVMGVPYLIMDGVFQIVNLYVNIFRNKVWAGANMWLVYNTFVSIFQGICSFLLVAEFPIYLLGSKAVRAFSFAVAFIYDVCWFFGFLVFLHYNAEAHAQNNNKNPLDMFNTVELLVDLFFAFNLVLNAPIFIMNLVILYKEWSFEKTEKNRVHFWGGQREEIVLSLPKITRAFKLCLDLLNPLKWIRWFFGLITHEDQELNEYYESLDPAERADLGLE